MSITTALLAASAELLEKVVIPAFQRSWPTRPDSKEVVAKFNTAAAFAQQLSGSPTILDGEFGMEFVARFSQFLELMRRVESCMSNIGNEGETAEDTALCAALKECCAQVDYFVDDLESLEMNSGATMVLDQTSDGGRLEQSFQYYPGSSRFLMSFTQSLLGQGSFGYTHRMRCSLNDRVYAVKRVDVQRLELMGITRERLEGESLQLQGLAHPNIARYYFSFRSREPEIFNIVTYLVEGVSMVDKIHATPAPTDSEVTEWGRQMASAMSYMHGQGVLHRDLRLDNVMLSARSRIKICDIKPACAVGFSAAVGRAVTELDVYSSYEKTHNMPYDGRDDVYAVGIILLSLLSRRRYVNAGDLTKGLQLAMTDARAFLQATGTYLQS
jgi:hypothetical protein